MNPLVYLVDSILGIYSFTLFFWLIIGWLISFGVLNQYNRVVSGIFLSLSRFFEPMLRYVRRYIHSIAGIDIAPLVVLLAVHFLRYTLRYYFL